MMLIYLLCMQLKDLTVQELKLYLSAHGLPLTGKKETLISRILTHMGKWASTHWLCRVIPCCDWSILLHGHYSVQSKAAIIVEHYMVQLLYEFPSEDSSTQLSQSLDPSLQFSLQNQFHWNSAFPGLCKLRTWKHFVVQKGENIFIITAESVQNKQPEIVSFNIHNTKFPRKLFLLSLGLWKCVFYSMTANHFSLIDGSIHSYIHTIACKFNRIGHIIIKHETLSTYRDINQ